MSHEFKYTPLSGTNHGKQATVVMFNRNKFRVIVIGRENQISF